MTDDDEPRWNPATRFAFRFFFVYLLLYNFPFPLALLPVGNFLSEGYQSATNTIVVPVGHHLFGVKADVLPNGSGDTTWNYIQVFCFAVASLVAAVIWSIFDRKRLAYPTLHRWLISYIRFALAVAMTSYGAAKVIKSQFPNATLDRLMERFGDASPMGLLWTFMGASRSYNVFTGAGEVIGGLLLTTRRTALLGALVSAAVLSNIAMLNFSYDVPVKLYSLHLLFMALFIAAPDARRLANFFFFDRPPSRARRFILVLRTVLVLIVVAFIFVNAQNGYRQWGDGTPKSPFYGIWNVDDFKVDGAPAASDGARWRRIIFDSRRIFAIQFADDRRLRYLLDLNAKTKQMALSKPDDPNWKANVAYSGPDRNSMILDGRIDGHAVHAELHRAETRSFLLTSRGFHWINEFPFNR
jgi:hypothetical protein